MKRIAKLAASYIQGFFRKGKINISFHSFLKSCNLLHHLGCQDVKSILLVLCKHCKIFVEYTVFCLNWQRDSGFPEFRQSFFGKHLDKALTDLPIIKTGKNNDLSLKQNFGGRASCGSFFASADIDSPEGNSIQLAGQFIRRLIKDRLTSGD